MIEAIGQGVTSHDIELAIADAAIIAQSQLTYVGHLLGDPAWFPVVSP